MFIAHINEHLLEHNLRGGKKGEGVKVIMFGRSLPTAMSIAKSKFRLGDSGNTQK